MANETATGLMKGVLGYLRNPPQDALDELQACKSELDTHLDTIHQSLSSAIDALAVAPEGTSPSFEQLNRVQDIIYQNREKIAKAWKLSEVIDKALSRHQTVGSYGMGKVALHEKIVTAREVVAAEINLDFDVKDLLTLIDEVFSGLDDMERGTIQAESRKLSKELVILDAVKGLRGHFNVIKKCVGQAERSHNLNSLRNSLKGIEETLSRT